MAKGKGKEVEPGTFEPALPGDVCDVVRLFAIAGRAVCAKPSALEEVTETLAAITQQLTPPAQLAAMECAELWGLFGTMAQHKKAALITEGARALYRDLDAVGQRLDLAPLESWQSLPESVTDKKPISLGSKSKSKRRALSLETVCKRAKAEAKKRRDPPLAPPDVLRLLAALDRAGREEMYKAIVGAGGVDRSDTILIEQILVRGDKVSNKRGSGQQNAADALIAIGRWLIQ